MTTITTTIRLPEDLVRAMQRLHARDGIVMSEQIRRALREWLTTKEVYSQTKEKKTYNPTKQQKVYRLTKPKVYTRKKR